MSLAINIDHVSEVLLSDGWHTVTNASFCVDALEYYWAELKDHREGWWQSEETGKLGALWIETNGVTVACPVRSILAVKLVRR